ncbi:hypothetical protein [Mariniluteicoccus flavus]
MSDSQRSPFARPTDDPTDPAPAAERPARAYADEPDPEIRRPRRSVPVRSPERVADDPVDRRPRRSRTPLWVAIGIGLVAVATVVAFVVRSQLTTPAAPPAGPGDVAQSYLAAVAAADAKKAQGLSAIKVDSPTFTNEALAASMKLAPISDIKVEAVNGQDVVLAYRRGDRTVRGTFPMVHVAEGWRVKRPTVRTRVAPSPQMIAPLLDGQKLQSGSYTYDVELAPGLHRLSLDGGFLEFDQPDIVVSGLNDQPQVNGKTRTTQAYPAELKKRLQARISECVKSQELAPKGCPWSFRAASGDTIEVGSVRYTMGSDPFATFRAPAPRTADAIVKGELRFPLTIDARTKQGGRSGTLNDEKLVIARYEADLALAELPFIWVN